jgi:hypothetical protein
MTTTTSRRAILAGAASLPALNIPAQAAQPDPIFAAIERHRAARAVWWESPDGETNEESENRLDRAGGAAEQTLADVLSTKPTTIAGCVALLRHVHDHLTTYEEGGEAYILSNAADDTGAAAQKFLLMIATALADAGVQS